MSGAEFSTATVSAERMLSSFSLSFSLFSSLSSSTFPEMCRRIHYLERKKYEKKNRAKNTTILCFLSTSIYARRQMAGNRAGIIDLLRKQYEELPGIHVTSVRVIHDFAGVSSVGLRDPCSSDRVDRDVEVVRALYRLCSPGIPLDEKMPRRDGCNPDGP